MANFKSNLTQTTIAFKKISGKANTTLQKTELDETIASNVQLDSSIIFGDKPPVLESHLALYDTSSNGVVQRVEFDLVPIPGTTYVASTVDAGAEASSATTHSFAAKLKDNYSSQDGSNSNSVSQNPKRDKPAFTNGAYASGSSGQLQFIPSFYGQLYNISLTDQNGDAITTGDDMDWYFDAFSGVLFRQDGTTSGDVPTSGTGYIYVGNFVSESAAGTTPSLQSVTEAGNVTDQGIIISGSLTATSSLVDFTGASAVSASALHVETNLGVDNNINVGGGVNIGGDLDVDGQVNLGTSATDVVNIAGNLNVYGNTNQIQVTNVNVEDKFLLLNSGSTGGNNDGGIIVQRASTSGVARGTAFYYDESQEVWAIAGASGSAAGDGSYMVDFNDTTAAPTRHANVVTVEVNLTGPPITVNGDAGQSLNGRPLVGKDGTSGNAVADEGTYAKGQFYVDNTDEYGLWVYI